MTTCSLNHFRLNGMCYHHFIDLETDATHLDDENHEIIYTVDSNAVLFDRAGKLGNFLTGNDDLWYFSCLSGLIFETGNKDLIKAEIVIFKHFLKH